jgi:hypothetical protein
MRFKAHPGSDKSMACENYHFVIFLDGTMVGLARASPGQSSFCDGAWTLAPLQLGSHQLQVVFRDAFDYEYSVGVFLFCSAGVLPVQKGSSFLYAFHIAPLSVRLLAACINSILNL